MPCFASLFRAAGVPPARSAGRRRVCRVVALCCAARLWWGERMASSHARVDARSDLVGVDVEQAIDGSEREQLVAVARVGREPRGTVGVVPR